MKNLDFNIGGLQKTSLLDYPEKVCAIVFTQGCNFNCGFCHNPALLRCNKEKGIYTPDNFFSFLETRKRKLDGIVITGGEPCLQPDLKEFIKHIKSMGFLVKLDTNGSFPEILEELIKERLIDYAAMDIKAPLEKYSFVTGVKIDADKIKKSISLIMNSGMDYEFRTTFMPYYHSIEDFENIGRLIKGAQKYYLQKFEVQAEVNNPVLKNEKNYGSEDIQKILNILNNYVSNVKVR